MKLKTLNKAALLLLAAAFFTSSFMPAYAATEKELSYDYYFEAESPSNLHYDVEEDIEVDGKHYRLKDLTYDIYSEPITEERSYKTDDKTAADYLTQSIQGLDIKLYAPEKIKWKDNKVEHKEEYASEAEIPDSIEHEGKTLKRKTVDSVSRVDNVSTTAVFYSEDPDENEYVFNGKAVFLDGGSPTWNGWRDDYASYLGISGSNVYNITGTAWQGGAVRQADGTYRRVASVYGTKLVNYVIATFDSSDDSERYTATVTYTSNYIAHAKAVYESYITTKQKIVYAAAGIGVLALLTSLVLFILAKRRKNEEG